MNRFVKKQDEATAREAARSGLRRKIGTERPTSELLDPENPGELWELVDFWITQIVPGDSRRRLLELARLRHDARLASAVLRYL